MIFRQVKVWWTSAVNSNAIFTEPRALVKVIKCTKCWMVKLREKICNGKQVLGPKQNLWKVFFACMYTVVSLKKVMNILNLWMVTAMVTVTVILRNTCSYPNATTARRLGTLWIIMRQFFLVDRSIKVTAVILDDLPGTTKKGIDSGLYPKRKWPIEGWGRLYMCESMECSYFRDV